MKNEANIKELVNALKLNEKVGKVRGVKNGRI